MKKISKMMKKSFMDMADISLKMINYGLKSAFFLLCVAILVCVLGKMHYGYSYERNIVNSGLALAAVSVFAQFSIAGIVFDILKKKQR